MVCKRRKAVCNENIIMSGNHIICSDDWFGAGIYRFWVSGTDVFINIAIVCWFSCNIPQEPFGPLRSIKERMFATQGITQALLMNTTSSCSIAADLRKGGWLELQIMR